MENKAVPLPAQFGSFVVPAARAISASASFVGVTFHFVGRVTSILDSDEGAFSIAGPFAVGDPVTGAITCDDHVGAAGASVTRGLYADSPAATLTVGSSFTESLPFAQSSPGLEMVVQKDTGGHSLNFESDFSLVSSGLFSTNVEVAMVISLTRSGGAFLNGGSPSRIALDDFDDRHFLITFFDTVSGNVSFLEVELEKFAVEATQKPDASEIRKPSNGVPRERRLTARRAQSNGGTASRWHRNGQDRRQGPGRRKEDRYDTSTAALSGLAAPA